MEENVRLIKCPHCGAVNRVPVERLKQNPLCGRCHQPLSLSSVKDRPLDITDQTFAGLIMKYPGSALVMFFSPGCPYCRQLLPVIDQLAPEFAGRVRIGKIDVDKNRTIPSQFTVDGVPTLIFFKNGKVLNRMTGVQPKEVLEKALQAIL